MNSPATQEMDVGYLFGESDASVRVRVNPRMYSIQSDATANWVWHAFRGFEILRRDFAEKCLAPRVFASIGSGSGVDAIGAARIFESLETIIVTDVTPDIVAQAVDNVRHNVRKDIRVLGLCGNLCTPLREAGIEADLLYANLPNIPLSSSGMIDHGTFYRAADDRPATRILDKYLLGLQYEFLQSAKDVLSHQGEVAFMVGGRFPLQILDHLRTSTAFALREVVAALKVQTEAESVTSGYTAWEKDGIAFEFYDYRRASALLDATSTRSGPELKALLQPALTSATAAHVLVRDGHTVAHTLHMMAGSPF